MDEREVIEQALKSERHTMKRQQLLKQLWILGQRDQEMIVTPPQHVDRQPASAADSGLWTKVASGNA